MFWGTWQRFQFVNEWCPFLWACGEVPDQGWDTQWNKAYGQDAKRKKEALGALLPLLRAYS